MLSSTPTSTPVHAGSQLDSESTRDNIWIRPSPTPTRASRSLIFVLKSPYFSMYSWCFSRSLDRYHTGKKGHAVPCKLQVRTGFGT